MRNPRLGKMFVPRLSIDSHEFDYNVSEGEYGSSSGDGLMVSVHQFLGAEIPVSPGGSVLVSEIFSHFSFGPLNPS